MPQPVSSFTEKSQREIKRMEDVIYTLLKLARLDAGIIQMKRPRKIFLFLCRMFWNALKLGRTGA